MSDSTNRLVIQIACGFARAPKGEDDVGALSVVDQQRRERLMLVVDGSDCATTGNVPYQSSDCARCTLAELNAHALTVAGLNVVSKIDGLNAFSESWNAVRWARGAGYTDIIIVSSDFYFTAYERMWRSAARRVGLNISIETVVSPRNVCNPAWEFYTSWLPQLMSRIAASSTLGHWLAMKLADFKTRKRKTEGFQMDGCRKIS